MSKNYGLKFTKGGRVSNSEWVYDREKEEGEYVSTDITDNTAWLHRRTKDVEFADDVTLNDVFEFVARDVDVADIIFTNCWIKDYVEEWKRIKEENLQPDIEEDQDQLIEYLELYWGPELSEYEGRVDIDGVDRADFHGIGFELSKDQEDGMGWKKGERITWGIDFSSLKDILHLPVRLNENFVIYDDWMKYKDVPNFNFKDLPRLIDCKRSFTLEQAIQGVMWELSFYGVNSEKEAVRAEVESRYEEVKDSLDKEDKNDKV